MNSFIDMNLWVERENQEIFLKTKQENKVLERKKTSDFCAKNNIKGQIITNNNKNKKDYYTLRIEKDLIILIERISKKKHKYEYDFLENRLIFDDKEQEEEFSCKVIKNKLQAKLRNVSKDVLAKRAKVFDYN